MSTKLNVPSTYFWEAGKYKELEYVVKTSSGAYNETSTTSLVVYSGNDGTQGLFDKLAVALSGYLVNASDFNAKWDYPNTQTPQTPTISYGQNLITNSDIADAYPDITFNGQSYVNLLGVDGNTETISKWACVNGTIAANTTEKSFGAQSAKGTGTAVNLSIFPWLGTPFRLEQNKYYMASGYLRPETSGGGYLGIGTGVGGSVGGGGVAVPQATVLTRKSFKFQATSVSTTDLYFWGLVYAVAGVTSVGSVDGFMVNEISATEYANDSVDVLMARYPYVDSYACLQNPAVEVVHDNMVRNGNGEEGVAWWTPSSASVSASIVSDKIRVTSASGALYESQIVKVKASTDYYLNDIIANGTATGSITVYGSGALIRTGAGTFNGGANTEVEIRLGVSGTGYADFSQIHLIPGTTAPTAYLPQKREQVVLEGKFAPGDTVSLKEGKLEGKVQWKHKVLYGRDYGWDYSSDGAGFKVIRMASPLGALIGDNATLIKGDGKVIAYSASITASDQFVANSSSYLYLGVSDADSGWTETLAPNANAVKAGENGWKANANNGTVYTSWISMVDGSAPPTNTEAYVCANVAPLYKGYRLHYKLANPESVGLSARLKGKVPKLEQGWNVVNVDAGVVLDETANPKFDFDSVVRLNQIYADPFATSFCAYVVEFFKAIYKSALYDLGVWNTTVAYSEGGVAPYTPIANFDPKAQYTVDYTILRTQAPVVGTPSMTYTPGVTDKINFDIEPIRMIDMPVTPSPDDLMEGDIVTVWGTSPIVVKRKRLNGLV